MLSRRAIALLVVLGLPVAIAAAYATLSIWFRARSECGDVGLTPGLELIFTMAWMAPLMWAAWSISLLAGRRRWMIGLALGAALVLAISIWWLSGTSHAIMSYGEQSCPTGVPAWWPVWLPH